MEEVNSSNGKAGLIKKLVEVMSEIDHVEKRGRNNFQNYHYVKAADLANAVRQKLASKHVLMLADVVERNRYDIATKDGKEVMQAVDINVLYTFYDGDTGESLSFKTPGTGTDKGDKAIYKALTGSLKYALRNSFLVPDESDPEADESVDKAIAGFKRGKKLRAGEHISDSCEQCFEEGIPAGQLAIHKNGHTFLDSDGDSHDNSKYCPACKGMKQTADSAANGKPKITGAFKAWIDRMGSAKEQLGDVAYYNVLGAHGFSHANEVKDPLVQKRIRDEMAQLYQDAKVFNSPTIPS